MLLRLCNATRALGGRVLYLGKLKQGLVLDEYTDEDPAGWWRDGETKNSELS